MRHQARPHRFLEVAAHSAAAPHRMEVLSPSLLRREGHPEGGPSLVPADRSSAELPYHAELWEGTSVEGKAAEVSVDEGEHHR